MDKEKSKYKESKGARRRIRLKKLVIDEEIIKDIPIEKRLVFELTEGASMFLYHKSIRDAIIAQNPQGIRFVNVDEWTNGSSFE